MWWNIFMTVFGCIIVILVGANALYCLNSFSSSKGELRRAWKKGFEGWTILCLLILLDVLLRVFKWIFN